MTKIMKTKPPLVRQAIVPILFDPSITMNKGIICSPVQKGLALLRIRVSTSRNMAHQRDISEMFGPHNRIIYQNESVYVVSYADAARAEQHQRHLGNGLGLRTLITDTASHVVEGSAITSGMTVTVLTGPARHHLTVALTRDSRLAGESIIEVEKALTEPRDRRRGEVNLFEAADLVVQAMYIGGYISGVQRDYHLLHSKARQQEILSDDAQAQLLGQLEEIVMNAPPRKRDAVRRNLRELLAVPKKESDPRFVPGAVVFHINNGPVKIIERLKKTKNSPKRFRVREPGNGDELDLTESDLRPATPAEVTSYVKTYRIKEASSRATKLLTTPVAIKPEVKKSDTKIESKVDPRLKRKGAIIFYTSPASLAKFSVKVRAFDEKRTRWEVSSSDGKVIKNVALANLRLATPTEVKLYQNGVRWLRRNANHLANRKKAEPAEMPGASKW